MATGTVGKSINCCVFLAGIMVKRNNGKGNQKLAARSVKENLFGFQFGTGLRKKERRSGFLQSAEE